MDPDLMKRCERFVRRMLIARKILCAEPVLRNLPPAEWRMIDTVLQHSRFVPEDIRAAVGVARKIHRNRYHAQTYRTRHRRRCRDYRT
jgi:hypothetical protein